MPTCLTPRLVIEAYRLNCGKLVGKQLDHPARRDVNHRVGPTFTATLPAPRAPWGRGVGGHDFLPEFPRRIGHADPWIGQVDTSPTNRRTRCRLRLFTVASGWSPTDAYNRDTVITPPQAPQ